MSNFEIRESLNIDSMPGAAIRPGTIVCIPITMSCPNGWLDCNSSNSTLNTFTYRNLHAVISNIYGGTAYSAGVTDISGATTTFSVPNLMGLSTQPVPIPANVVNTLVSNNYHTHTVVASSSLDDTNAPHTGLFNYSVNSEGAYNHSHANNHGWNSGGPTGNTTRRIGGPALDISHPDHTHYGESWVGSGGTYFGNHNHNLGYNISASEVPHSHTATVGSTSITTPSDLPPSHYVRYIIKA